jgi:segregation and condensation protein A
VSTDIQPMTDGLSPFHVRLPEFEGPLDLLLHLIRSHELDILDLPVAFVAERYLEYLDLMTHLNLDVASDYLVMAATLVYIKSRMLVPSHGSEDQDEPEDEGDPRAELIHRLLEYQKYKEVSERLGQGFIAGRDVFTRGSAPPEADSEVPLAEVGLFRLLDAFEGVLRRAKADLSREILPERISLHTRIAELMEQLRLQPNCRFEDLFALDADVYDLVVTFLAILEMAKKRLLRLAQSEPVAPIQLALAFEQAPEAEQPV